MEQIVLNQNMEVTIADIVDIARHRKQLVLSSELQAQISAQRLALEDAIANTERPIYGVNTGVGENSEIAVSREDAKALQYNIIVSHACGVGPSLSIEHVRATMVMMILNLSSGHSGIRLETLNTLVKLLNQSVHPVVPKEGSVGYLSHQAHISLLLIGKGEAYVDGRTLTGEEVNKELQLSPLELGEKEGLSLINGTTDMTGVAALALHDAEHLLKSADIISMMTFEALKCNRKAYDRRISRVKPHKGQHHTIENIHQLLRDSKTASEYVDYRTQDALSIRSIPQVHGSVKDAWRYCKEVVETEINSATDNPLIFFEDGEVEDNVLSSANPHGEPMALAMDFLAIAMAELANISERRIFRLVSPQYSELPGNLINDNGVNTGLMIPQYVAASLVSDNKVHAHPSSVDSIMTSGGQEDHVSMGTSATFNAAKVIGNAMEVIGIEWLSAAQALDFQKPAHSGKGTKAAHDCLRHYVSYMDGDRVLHKDIQQASALLRAGTLTKNVEAASGTLHS
ncbi:histidine ammonia-lyase [Thalassobacillus sp. CUG 92003]|uniref:histidine ammonia-lyase n=1 Tax=Thalassobacillus sp. CUG 92003 TaxID=2736641 RepID=UPI0015E7DB41|nr:histidine ammonia-lyase [Thalassobacillus sp. CUG 92003]